MPFEPTFVSWGNEKVYFVITLCHLYVIATTTTISLIVSAALDRAKIFFEIF